MVSDSFSVNLCFFSLPNIKNESRINKIVDNFVIFLIKDCEKVYLFDNGFTFIFKIMQPRVCCILYSKIAQYSTANIPETNEINNIFAIGNEEREEYN